MTEVYEQNYTTFGLFQDAFSTARFKQVLMRMLP